MTDFMNIFVSDDSSSTECSDYSDTESNLSDKYMGAIPSYDEVSNDIQLSGTYMYNESDVINCILRKIDRTSDSCLFTQCLAVPNLSTKY